MKRERGGATEPMRALSGEIARQRVGRHDVEAAIFGTGSRLRRRRMSARLQRNHDRAGISHLRLSHVDKTGPDL